MRFACFGSFLGPSLIGAAVILLLSQDLESRHRSLFDSVVNHSGGGTTLSAAFEVLLPIAEEKTVLILTDGDCDPSNNRDNPFQVFLRQTRTTTVVVWNLKQDQMSFPYAALDRRVAYVSGNTPEIIEPVMLALAEFGTNISPAKILHTALSRKDFWYAFTFACAVSMVMVMVVVVVAVVVRTALMMCQLVHSVSTITASRVR